jgi:hypothetical protein
LLAAVPAPAGASMADDPTASIQLGATITSVWNPPTEAAAATPFVVHRIANPRWRPPATSSLLPSAAPALRPGMLDHLSAQLYRSERASGPSSAEWQFLAGQQSRTQDGFEMFGALRQTPFRGTQLDALRLTGRRGIVSLSLGDQTPVVFGDWVSLQRMRGGVLRLESRETAWTTLGGVPTPLMGTPVAPIQVVGTSLDSGHRDAARYTLTALGFRRDRTLGRLVPDPAPGHGGLGAVGWRLPVGAGTITGTLGGQVHDLDGVRRLAMAQALAWDFATRRVAASLASARNTGGARIIGTDRFAPAPRAEDRWSLQARSAGGRFETHSTGVIRGGGDPALETRTFAAGFSGAFGRSAWYGGADAVWDRRLVSEERRYSVQAGRALVGSATMLARFESVERPNRPVTLSALGETSVSLAAGTRLELEPRLGFAEHEVQNGQLTARLSGPLGGPELRMTGTL